MDNVIPFPSRSDEAPEPEVDTTEGSPQPWYHEFDNILIVGEWMAQDGWEASDVVDLFRKPWQYDDEFQKAALWMVEKIDSALGRHPAGSQLPH